MVIGKWVIPEVFGFRDSFGFMEDTIHGGAYCVINGAVSIVQKLTERPKLLNDASAIIAGKYSDVSNFREGLMIENSVTNLMLNRRSVRKYKTDKPSDDVV